MSAISISHMCNLKPVVFLESNSLLQASSNCILCLAFTMDSNLHIWEVLIALMIILNSHFQFYAYATSLSFSSGTLITDPLTADNTATRKDPIFHWSSPLHRLTTGGSSTPGILPTSNRTTSIHTDTKNGDSVPRITPTSQSSVTSPQASNDLD